MLPKIRNIWLSWMWAGALGSNSQALFQKEKGEKEREGSSRESLDVGEHVGVIGSAEPSDGVPAGDGAVAIFAAL